MSLYLVESAAATVTIVPAGGSAGCAASSRAVYSGPVVEPSGQVIAVRLEDVVSPAGQPLSGDQVPRSALVVAGTPQIASGDRVVFCKIVAVAPAVIRRDGHVQADGHLEDHVRLGAFEEVLNEAIGNDDVIAQIAEQARLSGRVKGSYRSSMTATLAIRCVLLSTVLPDADQVTVMRHLAGDLALVPWRKPWRVPTAQVLSNWSHALGSEPFTVLQQRLLMALDQDYRAGSDGFHVGDLAVFAVDGSITRVADTPVNRAAFGSTGTKGDAGPYPQTRGLYLTHAADRQVVAVVHGPAGTDKAEAEQKLLDRMLTQWRWVFTPERLFLFDRNYLGVKRIKRLLATGAHVLIRVKSDVVLTRLGGFFPDGSYPARIRGDGDTLKVRVIEYHVTGGDELICLITDLPGDRAYPASVLAAAYPWRWTGAETALKEAKSAITGHGPSTGAMLAATTPSTARGEHAAWIIMATLTRSLSRHAAEVAKPARRGNQAGLPVQPRQISFTAARRMGLDSLTAMTASLPAAARRHMLDDLLKRLGTERVQVDRHRHRDRVVKTRQAFGHAKGPVTTATAKAELDLCAPPPPAAATTGTATSTGHDQAAATARRPRRPATGWPQTPANRRNRNGKRRTKRAAATAPPSQVTLGEQRPERTPPSRQDHREAIMKI